LAIEGGKTQLIFTGQFADNKVVTTSVNLSNKINAMDAVFLRAYGGDKLYVAGNRGSYSVNFNLNKIEFTSFISLARGDFANSLDFSSGYGRLFFPDSGILVRLFNNIWLEGSPVFIGPPFAKVISLFSDMPNKRLIAVDQDSSSGVDNVSLFGHPINDLGRLEGKPTLLWRLPGDVIQGTFKFSTMHGSSKTIIIADERLLQARRVTVIQGFSEAGQKRFEAVVGPDISNLVVDESRSAVYVAEHHESPFAQLKAININSGEVSNLIESFGDAAVGAVTVLHMDNPNNQLYIGDDISDTVFTLDFSARALRALSLEGFEFIDLNPVEVN
jgi:hypothetical protein